MKEEYLKNILKKIKKDILFTFKESIIGDPDEKDIQELKKELKKMKEDINLKNIELTKLETEKFLEENFKHINDKVSNNGYESISEYKEEIEQFIEFCINKCPMGPGRDVIIYEYLINNLINNSDNLSKNSIAEKEKNNK